MRNLFQRNILSVLLGCSLIYSSSVSASEVMPKILLALNFGAGNQSPAMTLHSGFSNLPLASSEVLGFVPVVQWSLFRDGQLNSSILGKALHASETGSSRSWVWWAVGAAAVVAVVAVAAGGSGKDEPVTEGSATTVCGNNDVLIGDECVAVPR